MTTKERLEMMIESLEKEQTKIIEEVATTQSIDYIISLGKQAEKNQTVLSFARATVRLK
jgi:hypothetical protein